MDGRRKGFSMLVQYGRITSLSASSSNVTSLGSIKFAQPVYD